MATGTLSARANILAALGATSLALIAAGPPNAAYRSHEPSGFTMTASQSSAVDGEDWIDVAELKV
jgi:hypothetical protein